jgi:hypothetical protein
MAKKAADCERKPEGARASFCRAGVGAGVGAGAAAPFEFDWGLLVLHSDERINLRL